MAGESTNNPQGARSNPGRPPINDQGAAMSNPAPKVPDSLPKPADAQKAADALEKMRLETEKGVAAHEEFIAQEKKLKLVLKQHEDALKAANEAQKAYADAMVKSKEASIEFEKTKKGIEDNYKEFVDELTGNWKEGTDSLRLLHDAEMAAAASKHEEAKLTEERTRDEYNQSKLRLMSAEKERIQTDSAIEYLKELAEILITLDSKYEKELTTSINTVVNSLSDGSHAFEKFQSLLDVLPKSLKDINQKIAMEELKDNAAKEKKLFEERQESLKKQDEQFKASQKVFLEESMKAKDEEVLEALNAQGGVAGATDMKKFLDEFVEVEKERFKKISPDASDEDIARRVMLALAAKGKEFTSSKISEKAETERLELEKKFIDKMMSEKSVSKQLAQQMVRDMRTDKSSEMYKELKEINDKEKEQLTSLQRMDDTQIQALQRADQERVERLQDKAEGAGKEPQKLFENLGNRVASKLDSLKGAFGEIFGQNSGWLKKILLVLTMVIGATIGYIWYKIQSIVKILSFIPGLGKIFGGIGGAFSNLGGAVSGMFGRIFGPIMNFIRPILNLFPKITGTMSAFSKAFSIGFHVLGKLLFYITLAFDVIMGAVKGFQKLGNIEGVLMGAVAGLVKFFTFGLIEFDDIFEALKFLGPLFKNLGDQLRNFWTLITDIFNVTLGSWSKAFKILGSDMAWGEKVKELIKVASKQMASLIGILGKYVINSILDFFDGIFSSKSGSVVDNIVEIVTKGFSLLWETMVTAFTGLFEYIKSGQFVIDVTKALMGGKSEEEKKQEMELAGLSEEEQRAIDEYSKTRGDEAYRQAVEEGNYQGAEYAKVQAEKEAYDLEFQRVKTERVKSKLQASVSAKLVDLREPKAKRTFFAQEISAATAEADRARMAMTKPGSPTTAISAPATTIVNGGGGEPTVLMAPVSRNNDPTFRGISYGESPAL